LERRVPAARRAARHRLPALDPLFTRIFGQSGVWREWFAQMLQSAFVTTITGQYADFGRIGGAVLQMVAARRGVTLLPEDFTDLRDGVRRLPAHPEVPGALASLRDAGLQLVALTNSTLEVAEAQLTHAGIREKFEQVFSADGVRRLKPAPEPYRMVAERLGVSLGDVTLVAAHAWDIAGAARVGCKTAFVARPGMVVDPLAPAPMLVGADLVEVAQRILEAGGRQDHTDHAPI
jgi:2-haloacid dehalogenase